MKKILRILKIEFLLNIFKLKGWKFESQRHLPKRTISTWLKDITFSKICLYRAQKSLEVREGAEKKKKNKWWNFHHTGGGSLIFHHFPSFQQFFFLASKWPNSSRNAKKKISIFGDPPSNSASSQAFYVKIRRRLSWMSVGCLKYICTAAISPLPYISISMHLSLLYVCMYVLQGG